MSKLCLIAGDQLNMNLSCLQALDPDQDHVVMAELSNETGYVQHHVQKIALIFSAMRHFADRLGNEGYRVHYHSFDPSAELRTFTDAIKACCDQHDIDQIVLTRPGEWRVLDEFNQLEDRLGIPVQILEDDRFLSTPEEFANWAEGRKTLRMEFFYREMRKRTGLLMDEDDQPVGGQWNYDAENRKKWTGDPESSAPMHFQPDEITQQVLDLVAEHFDGFGELEGFDYAVTTGQARRALSHFIKTALPWFGDFQDALPDDEDYLFHSRISAYLNIGLLQPLEVCQAVAEAWQDQTADAEIPLNAVEGYIRQVLGWREFIRGIYWLKMPEYAELNQFDNQADLPDWYWSGDTDMRCLAKAISATRRNAYAHHIQRLMVTGNFALLLGIVPKQICDWYLAVYADAFDWVELPNTLGMVMHADGGLLGSKPYAASGKYIQRMGDHCKHCRYNVQTKNDSDSCPFNSLYWDFLIRHQDQLKDNARMRMMYRNVDRMSGEDRKAVLQRAEWIKQNVEDL